MRKPTVAIAERERCEEHGPRSLEDRVEPVREDRAPRRVRRRYPEAQEGEARLGGDCARGVHREEDEERCDDVGNDVDGHDPQAPGPEGALGKDVLVLLGAQHEGAAGARVVGAEGHRDHDDQVAERRAEHREKRKCEHDGGKRLEGVGQEHDDVVDQSTQVPAQETEDQPDGEGGRHGGHGHLELDPRPVDETGKQVPAELVGPEEMVQGWSLERVVHVDLAERVRRQLRPEDRQHDEPEHDDGADRSTGGSEDRDQRSPRLGSVPRSCRVLQQREVGQPRFLGRTPRCEQRHSRNLSQLPAD